jgi:hypothetical protein
MPGMPKNVLLDWFVTKTMERDAKDRFQSAREMLEHWWNVMSSLAEEEETDVSRGRSSSLDPPYEEDRTVQQMRRPEPPSIKLATATLVASPSPVSSGRDATLQDLLELSPNTEPSPNTLASAEGDFDDDPFDIPTRNDPNLRKLVEQELELHRKRKTPPR